MLLLAVCLAEGCEGDGGAEAVGLSLALADAAACRPPSAIDAVRFEALGHFAPGTPGAVVTLAPTEAPATTVFPEATRVFVVEASAPTWSGVGVAFRPADDASARILVLPLGRACGSVDPELRAPPESVVAGLPDGALVVAGGRDDGQASRRVIVRAPGERFAEVVLGGLASRREGAAATAVGERVVVTGGGLGDAGPALDSYEVYDHGARAMDRDAAGLLVAPRREHGAAALADGRVLLVGGVGEAGGAPLASAELLDPGAGASSPVGPLPVGRRAPRVAVLDDGTALVLGGTDGEEDEGAPEVLVFDPAGPGFAVAPGVALPPYRRARAVPLPGARVAYLGDSGPGASTAAIHVLRVGSDGAIVDEVVEVVAELPELVAVDAAATASGRVVVTGEDSAGDARAFLVDLGLARAVELPSLGLPSALVVLADGLAVALDAAGARFYREDALTAYDHPPSILVDAELAFDAPARWAGSGPVRFTAAEDGARFDVAPYRFEDLVVEAFEVEVGEAELLLVPAAADPVAIAVTETAVSLGECATERAPGAALSLERRGPSVTLSAGGAARTCRVEALVGEVRVAVRASAGATVRAPTLRRP